MFQFAFLYAVEFFKFKSGVLNLSDCMYSKCRQYFALDIDCSDIQINFHRCHEGPARTPEVKGFCRILEALCGFASEQARHRTLQPL